jgi:RNAse (barnase) inhibitor barstar
MHSEIQIDVSGVLTTEALHELLADTVSFPDYYGRNWDVFWDCITDSEHSQMPMLLRVEGWATLNQRLPREARLFRECLDELPCVRPECRVEWAGSELSISGSRGFESGR